MLPSRKLHLTLIWVLLIDLTSSRFCRLHYILPGYREIAYSNHRRCIWLEVCSEIVPSLRCAHAALNPRIMLLRLITSVDINEMYQTNMKNSLTLKILARYSLQAGAFLITSQFVIWSFRNFGGRNWHLTELRIGSIFVCLFSSSYLTHFSTALYTSFSSWTLSSSFFMRFISWMVFNCRNSSSWQIYNYFEGMRKYRRWIGSSLYFSLVQEI